jgi:hypothetical protein
LNTITVISLIVGIVTGAFGLYIAVDKFVIEKTSCRISGHVYTQTGGDALLGAKMGPLAETARESPMYKAATTTNSGCSYERQALPQAGSHA